MSAIDIATSNQDETTTQSTLSLDSTTTQIQSSSQQLENDIPLSYPCSGYNCTNIATMQCPTCIKYNGPSTYFCNQDCFKTNWAVHSRCHPELRAIYEYKPPFYAYTGPLRPAYITKQIKVLNPNIKQPDYAHDGIPHSERTSRDAYTAPIYTKDEIIGIKAAAQLTRKALDYACSLITPGITTDAIDKATHEFIIKHGGYPSPLNYRGFPKSICVSINEVICHGIPDCRPLVDGDIINIDISVYLNGFHGDANEIHCVGNNVDFESKRLIKAAYDSLFNAIQLIKPGTLFRDFGEAVSTSIKKHNYSSVKSFTGHGIGHLFHCAPYIPHYARNKATGACKPGMIFSLEPMINAGKMDDVMWGDDWTAVTRDGKRSAQFEHTILVTENGYELLTKRTEKSKKLWWEEECNKDDLIKYNEIVNGNNDNKSVKGKQ